MKKKLLIGLGSFFTLCIVAIIAAVVYFWPFIKTFNPSLITYSNIKSLYIWAVMDDAQKTERSQDIDRHLSQKIQDYVQVEIRDFTEDEKIQIESGEKTKTEVIAQIITENTQKPDTTVPPVGETEVTPDVAEPVKPDNNNSTNAAPKETADEIVARHITILYGYHSDFEGRVAALATSARNWMHVYKKAHPGITWRDAKVATMQHFMDTATAIENECYAQVDKQILALENDLKAIGADLSVVATVRDAAYNEMDIRKSKIVAEGTEKMNKPD